MRNYCPHGLAVEQELGAVQERPEEVGEGGVFGRGLAGAVDSTRVPLALVGKRPSAVRNSVSTRDSVARNGADS